jgi:hypothetical protein
MLCCKVVCFDVVHVIYSFVQECFMVIYFHYVKWGWVSGIWYSGVRRVSGMCVSGPLLVKALGIVVLIRLSYEFVVWGGRLSGVMNCFHEAFMVVSRGVVSEGSFLSHLDARRKRVALRVSREVRGGVLGPGLSMFGSLAMIRLVGWICRV